MIREKDQHENERDNLEIPNSMFISLKEEESGMPNCACCLKSFQFQLQSICISVQQQLSHLSTDKLDNAANRNSRITTLTIINVLVQVHSSVTEAQKI